MRHYGFFLKCLRLVRAYNFDNTLIKQIEEYFNYFIKSGKISDNKLSTLNYFFTLCFEKLKIKVKQDPTRASDETFQHNFMEFEKVYKNAAS